MFERFVAAAAAAVSDARLDYFKRTLWPRLAQSSASGLLLFVPSYFDFVRLR